MCPHWSVVVVGTNHLYTQTTTSYINAYMYNYVGQFTMGIKINRQILCVDIEIEIATTSSNSGIVHHGTYTVHNYYYNRQTVFSDSLSSCGWTGLSGTVGVLRVLS